MLHRVKSSAALPVLLAALATLSSACATAQDPSRKSFDAPKNPAQTNIFIGVKGKKQVLYPEKAYLWTGAGAEERAVWWIFVHKQATIRFKSGNPQAIPDVPCQALGKATICSWVIPELSLKKGIYRYSVVNGLDDNGNALDDTDPDIEIDR